MEEVKFRLKKLKYVNYYDLKNNIGKKPLCCYKKF